MWEMAGSSMDAADLLGQKPQIKIKASRLRKAVSALTDAPISINIYTLELPGMGQS